MPTAAVSAARRGLHRWIETGSRAGASSLNRSIKGRPSAFSFSESSVGIASPDGGGEPLRDLIGREDRRRSRVHPVRVRAQRQAEHHVREIDGLAPRRRPHLQSRDIHELEVALHHQEVRRLEIPVSEPCVPEMPDEVEALVDHGVVHVRIAEVPAPFEELRDEHVLAVRGQLDDAVGPCDANPCVAERAKRIVLVGHEAPHRAHRRLVLQLAVQDLPDHAIPAVGSSVAGGVHLREHPGAVVQGHPQRGGPTGALQAERFDLGDRQPELVAHRPDDRPPAFPAEVEVRGVPPTLQRHREHVLRHERPEGRPGEDGGEHPRVAHRDYVVRRQDQLGENDREERPVHDPPAPPGGSARDEHERDTDQRDRERRDR